MQTIHLDKLDEATSRIVAASFPDYAGRKWKLRVSDAPLDCASYWDGGSRSYFRFVRLADMKASDELPAQSAFDAPVSGIRSVTLPEGVVCVEHSIFCGKDTGLTIHLLPANAAPLLPASQEITREERIVLIATCSLKNSHNGIKDYRFHEAHQDTGITREAWDIAKVSLVSKGLLDTRGAVTANGRNAAGTTQLYQLKQQESAQG